MKLNRSLALLVLVAWVVVIPAPAAGQVKAGQNIQMTTVEGLVTSGKVLWLSTDEMDFKDGDGNVSRVAFGGVRRIRVADSKANGFIGGVLAGGLSVVALHLNWYYGIVPVPVPVVALYGGHLKTGVIGGAIIGGLVGLAIDSRRMKTVYERGDPQIAVKLHPIVSAAGKGIGAQVRW